MDIHRCRFVDYTPHTITAMAFSHASNTAAASPAGLRLAVGRSNGDIEIWNPRHSWSHELTLPGARGRAIEGLVWAQAPGENARLFSIGGSTAVTEWDLCTMRPRANYDCNAGVVWCVDANDAGDRLAVGCDDGSVVLVDISGGAGVLAHDRVCQRQELRVLGLRWYGNEMLIGGCADGKVRCWAAGGDARGRIVALMKVDKSKTESTLVWSIAALPARGQFVTGDSTGAVKFWDAATFTMVQGFAVHDADVLCLAKDAAGEKVFSAGIDRKIHQYSLAPHPKRAAPWVHNFSRLLHLNDVRALAMFESKAYSLLVSGGAERALIVQPADAFASGPYKKILMAQQLSNVAICGAAKLVAMFQDHTVKIWRVAEDDLKHKLVAKLTMADEDNICAVSLGDPVDGVSVLAVASINAVKVFSLTDAGHKLQVRKYRDPDFDAAVGGAKRVWVYNATSLLLLTPEDELYKFSVRESTIELDDEIDGVGEPANALRAGFDHFNGVRSVAFSPANDVVAVARFNNSIEVLPLDGSAGYVLTKLSSAVHLICFTHDGTLAVLLDENRLYVFNLGRGASLLTPWSQRNSEVMPLTFLRLDDKPQGMFENNNKVWIYGSRWLAFFDLTLNLEVSKLYASKVRKRNRDGMSIREIDGNGDLGEFESALTRNLLSRMDDDDDDSGDDDEDDDTSKPKMPFWITQKYRPILKVDRWGPDDICVVEREAFALPTTSAFQTTVMKI